MNIQEILKAIVQEEKRSLELEKALLENVKEGK